MGKPATILLIEDEQDLREILTEELTESGYAVVQASNGREALQALDASRPNLILCDIAMPVMDGYAFLRTLRDTLPALSDVPFMFLSAQDTPCQIIQGKYAGADDYLVKPVNFDLMLATIAARIRQVRRVRDTLAGDPSPHAEPPNPSRPSGAPDFRRLARMFNLITAGIVVLDTEGRTQFANIAAQRLLSGCKDLASLGIFNADGLENFQASSPVIRAAIEAGLNGLEYTDFLSLPRWNGQRDLLVTVCALDCAGHGGDDLAAALFISAGERNEPAPIKALEFLFKLTPTEGRIAWAFAQGLRPDQIAESFDISLTTVAFHKRNIFQKTHTNRQADLIALLLTLPAAGEPQ